MLPTHPSLGEGHKNEKLERPRNSLVIREAVDSTGTDTIVRKVYTK